MFIRDYFDLNSPVGTLSARSKAIDLPETVKPVTLPDLDVSVGTKPKKPTAKPTTKPTAHATHTTHSTTSIQRAFASIAQQLTMVVGVVIGVLAKPVIDSLANGKGVIDWQLNPAIVVASLLIALILLPAIWKNVVPSAGTPFVVKLGLFIQQGYFWPSLLGSLAKQ